jgi:hypothetical protein
LIILHRIKFAFIYLLPIVLFGCSARTAEVHLETKPIDIRKGTAATTQMNTIPTARISPSVTPSLGSCRSVQARTGPPAIHGKLIAFSDDGNEIVLWDVETNQQTVLGEVVIPSIAVAADGEFAFIDSQENRLVVYSPMGDLLFAFPVPENWIEVLGWTSNHNLLIGNMPFHMGGGWNPPSSTILFRIENGEFREMLPDYPDIDLLIAGQPWVGTHSYSLASYDPTITRVVYPASTTNGKYIVLRDMESVSEIMRIQSPGNYADYVWSADGVFFITAAPPFAMAVYPPDSMPPRTATPSGGGSDLFTITRNGEVERLTYLSARTGSLMEWHPSVSPDGQKVAFWITRGTSIEEWQLGVLQMNTGEVDIYCILEEGSHQIFWSTESRHLLTTTVLHDWKTHKLLWIDTDEKKAIEWEIENLSLHGWLDN